MPRNTHGQRCSAHSSQTGQPCRAWACHGATVCVTHGGNAPQVKLAAAERIRTLVDPALNRLTRLIDDANSAVALAAVVQVLDRAGYGVRQQLDINIRLKAEQLATELGCTVEEIVAEAERLALGQGR